jgi:hypothetical protein
MWSLTFFLPGISVATTYLVPVGIVWCFERMLYSE